MLSLLKSEAIRKEFFERFYINKQNVVQASHIKLMSDEQKKNNRQ